jgi:tetratricopeptide (TPR) repeat protein
LEGLLAKTIDEEGSLLLKVQSDSRTPQRCQVPVEARCPDTDTRSEPDPHLNLLLHVVEGKLFELEIYKDDSSPILGDAAVNEAFRLRPALSEVHLAMALHLYIGYNERVRARIQIDIAAKTMSNDPELLQLSALIDQEQGRWENSIAGLEKAATLDPRNPDLLDSLEWTYFCLRQYRNNERILDRLIDLEPDQPSFRLRKADSIFAEGQI